MESPPVAVWQVGCQTRPWLQTMSPEDFTSHLPATISHIAEAGFSGFEAPLIRLPLESSSTFRRMLAASGGIRLCGAHAGGRWWVPDIAAHIETLTRRAAALPEVGCSQLVVSLQEAPAHPTEEDLTCIAANLGALAESCRRAAGVRVGFHNHAAELADDARILAAIVDRCDPDDIQLAADLGWVAYAGVDVRAFIHRFGDRLAYLHLRDITPEKHFVEVGRGALDYPGLLRALEAEQFDGWLVAESEFSATWAGEKTPEATVAAQFTGIRSFMTTS